MVAFAANSWFNRLALIDPNNDPISFTLIRILSGALLLSFVLLADLKASADANFSWVRSLLSAAFLFFYALFFALAYVRIEAGTGALILFAMVQLTMIVGSYLKGQRLARGEVAGFLLALGGLIYLLLPGFRGPTVGSLIFMVVSGVSWGIYSLLGQLEKRPVAATARNFLLATPLLIPLFILLDFQLTSHGWLWAVLSGSIASGMGYVMWYITLGYIKTSTGAIMQLTVPAITAFGGVFLLGEDLTARLLIASGFIILGVLVKTVSK